MLKISNTLQNLPDYPFARVGRISKETEQKDGVKVINARIGIPDVEAPQSIKEYLAKYIMQEKSTFGYPCDVYPARGIPEFVEAIIEDYRRRYNVTLTAENVCVTSWTKEVLHNMVRMFEPGNISSFPTLSILPMKGLFCLPATK